MLCRSRSVCVTGSHSIEVQSQCFGHASRYFPGIHVKDRRRQETRPSEAGEQVATEKQFPLWRVVAGVTGRMTRKMDGFETSPHIQLIAIIEHPVRCEGLKRESATSNRFQHPDTECPPGICRPSLIVWQVTYGSGDPGTGFARERLGIEGVVQVSMGQEDASNGKLIPASFRQGALQRFATSHKATINQIESIVLVEDIEVRR